MKKKYIKDLAPGETIDQDPFSISKIGVVEDGKQLLELSDSSGTIDGSILTSLLKGISLVEGMVVLASGVILNNGRFPVFALKEISVATNYVPAELFPGLPPKKIEEYINDINEVKSLIQHSGYRALVDACLTTENLKKLATLPATIGYYGVYPGGALAATDLVTRMVLTSMTSYTKRGNGLSSTSPSWPVLITASLLYLFGNIRYFTPAPFARSAIGLSMGYFPTLQSMLVEAMVENHVTLTDDEKSLLFNVLQVAASTKTEVSAVSKEGPILRHTISLYAECDAIDWEVATLKKDDKNYFYSPKFNRYLMPADSRR